MCEALAVKALVGHQLSPSRPPASTDNNQGWKCGTDRGVQLAGVEPAERRRRAARQEQVGVETVRARDATWIVL